MLIYIAKSVKMYYNDFKIGVLCYNHGGFNFLKGEFLCIKKFQVILIQTFYLIIQE